MLPCSVRLFALARVLLAFRVAIVSQALIIATANIYPDRRLVRSTNIWSLLHQSTGVPAFLGTVTRYFLHRLLLPIVWDPLVRIKHLQV
jgi:hypothetical protein